MIQVSPLVRRIVAFAANAGAGTGGASPHPIVSDPDRRPNGIALLNRSALQHAAAAMRALSRVDWSAEMVDLTGRRTRAPTPAFAVIGRLARRGLRERELASVIWDVSQVPVEVATPSWYFHDDIRLNDWPVGTLAFLVAAQGETWRLHYTRRHVVDARHPRALGANYLTRAHAVTLVLAAGTFSDDEASLAVDPETRRELVDQVVRSIGLARGYMRAHGDVLV